MTCELISGSHSVFEANYHIQLTPAYRCGVFADELIRVLTRDYLLVAGKKHDIKISAIGFGNDHIHLFVQGCKNTSLAEIVRILKGYSSYMMRKNHFDLIRGKLWGKKFWSSGYFARTVGTVNNQTVIHYVSESQEYKHEDRKQSKIIEFSA